MNSCSPKIKHYIILDIIRGYNYMTYIMFTSYEIPGICIYKWQTLNSKIVILPKEKRTGLKHNESAKLVEIYKLKLIKTAAFNNFRNNGTFAFRGLSYDIS